MRSTSKRAWRSPWFWLAVAAVGAFAAFMLFSDTGKEIVESVNDWAQGLIEAHPVAGALVFFALSAVSAIMAFMSTIVLVPAASEVWGRPLTFALLWGGWLAGSVVTYAIGHFGRSLLYRMVSREDLRRYEQFASRKMKLWLATLLCLAVPSEIPGYLFGALRYPFIKFIIAIGSAEAVYAVGVVIAGDSLAQAKPVVLIATGAMLVAVAVAAGYVLHRQRKRA